MSHFLLPSRRTCTRTLAALVASTRLAGPMYAQTIRIWGGGDNGSLTDGTPSFTIGAAPVGLSYTGMTTTGGLVTLTNIHVSEPTSLSPLAGAPVALMRRFGRRTG